MFSHPSLLLLFTSVILLLNVAPCSCNYTGLAVFQVNPSLGPNAVGIGQMFTPDFHYGLVAYRTNDTVASTYPAYLQSVTRSWNETTMQWSFQTNGPGYLLGKHDTPLPATAGLIGPVMSISVNGSKVGLVVFGYTAYNGTLVTSGLYHHNTQLGTFQLAHAFSNDTIPGAVVSVPAIVVTGDRGDSVAIFSVFVYPDPDPPQAIVRYYNWSGAEPVVNPLYITYNLSGLVFPDGLSMDHNETVVAFLVRLLAHPISINFTLATGPQGTFPSIPLNVTSGPQTTIKIETTHTRAIVGLSTSNGTHYCVRTWGLERITPGGWDGTWISLPTICSGQPFGQDNLFGAQISFGFITTTNRWRMAIGDGSYGGHLQGAVLIYDIAADGTGNWELQQTLGPFGANTTNVNATLGYSWISSTGLSADGLRLMASGPCLDGSCQGAVYNWETEAPPSPPTVAPPVAPPVTPCSSDCECNTASGFINECMACLNGTCQITRTCGIEDPGLVCVMDGCYPITPACNTDGDCSQDAGCTKCVSNSCRQINSCLLGCESPETCTCNSPPPPPPMTPCTSDCECNTASTSLTDCITCVEGLCQTTHTCGGMTPLCQMGTCLAVYSLCSTSADCPQTNGCSKCVGNSLGFLLGRCRQINNCTLGCESTDTCQCSIPPPPVGPPVDPPVIPPVPVPLPPVPPSPQPATPTTHPTQYFPPLPLISDPPQSPGIGHAGPITGPTSIIPEYIDDTPTYVKVLTFVAAAGIVVVATYAIWVFKRVYRADVGRGGRSRLM